MDSSRVLIVFDLDGTVVDAFEDIRAAVNHALAARGLPVHDIETIRGYVGNGLVRLCERALPTGHDHLLDEVVADTRAYYAAHPADLARVYPDMREAIADLRAAGHPTALLSNKPDNLVHQVTARLELEPLFDLIVGEKSGVALKPDPAALLALMQQTNAQRAIVIGDGLPDAQVARAAGQSFIGVAWGQGTEETLGQHGPVIRDATQLVTTIRTINS